MQMHMHDRTDSPTYKNVISECSDGQFWKHRRCDEQMHTPTRGLRWEDPHGDKVGPPEPKIE